MKKEFVITENNVLSIENPRIIFKITLSDIKKLISFDDDVEEDDIVYKEFKYSEDGITYSYWSELTNDKLTNLTLQSSSVLKIRYNFNPTSESPDNITIGKLILEYEESDELCEIKIKPESGSSIEINNPNFDVYQRPHIASNLQQKLSKSVNEFIGLQSIYYKSNVLSTDTFLHEHTLLELADECGVEIKVMFEDNEMPEKPLITPFGTTFEVPVQVHIDYLYFKEHFGDHVPSHGDIVFIPITKGIWEVNGSDIIRGVMNQPIYWQITLAKYNPKANRFEDSLKHDSILDNLQEEGFSVMSAEKSFKKDWEENEEKVIKPRESRLDGVNEKSVKRTMGDTTINNLIKVINEEIENNFIIVSHFNYNIGAVPEDNIALKYNVNFETEGDISYSAWLKFKEIDNTDNILVKVEANKIYSSKFVNTTEDTNYTLQKRREGILYDTVINGNDTVINGNDIVGNTVPNGLYYVVDKKFANIYNNWNILNNRYIVNTEYNISIDLSSESLEIQPNFWYGIIITESARYNQTRIFIYELNPHNEDLKLFYDSGEIYTEIEKIEIENLQINGGLSNITNIRLFDEMLQIDDHHIILNQQFVNDSQKAVVIDNVKPELIREEYGRPL